MSAYLNTGLLRHSIILQQGSINVYICVCLISLRVGQDALNIDSSLSIYFTSHPYLCNHIYPRSCHLYRFWMQWPEKSQNYNRIA